MLIPYFTEIPYYSIFSMSEKFYFTEYTVFLRNTKSKPCKLKVDILLFRNILFEPYICKDYNNLIVETTVGQGNFVAQTRYFQTLNENRQNIQTKNENLPLFNCETKTYLITSSTSNLFDA